MYSTAVAAGALGIAPRELDNLVNRYCRDSVPARRQGSSRAIDGATVERLAVALLLRRDLRIPFERGWSLADALLTDVKHQSAFGSLGTIAFDVPRLRAVVRQALADSVAGEAPARRGRPPVRNKRGAPL